MPRLDSLFIPPRHIQDKRPCVMAGGTIRFGDSMTGYIVGLLFAEIMQCAAIRRKAAFSVPAGSQRV
jgi:hypothetical protein